MIVRIGADIVHIARLEVAARRTPGLVARPVTDEQRAARHAREPARAPHPAAPHELAVMPGTAWLVAR